MTLDESTTEGVQPSAPATRPRRSRRATKAVAAPEAVATEATTTTAAPEASVEAAAPDDAAAAPSRRRKAAAPRPARTRATKKTAAAQPTEVPALDEQRTVAPEPAVEATDAVTSEAPPAAPARSRRRATKKTAAPESAAAPAQPAELAPAETAPVQTAAAEREPAAEQAPAEAPAAPARRRRSRKSAAPDAPVAEAVAEATPTAAEVPAESAVAASGDAPAEVAPEARSGRGRRAPLAATALLFQPPEATPRRRRAASRPSGPPVAPAPGELAGAAVEEDEESALVEETTEGLPTGPAADVAATAVEVEVEETEDADDTEDTDDASEEGGAEGRRRRRRRGGRGRRGRTRTDAGEAGESAEDAETAVEPQPAADEDEPAAAEDDDQAEDGESGSSSRRRRRRRRRGSSGADDAPEDPPGTTTRVREPRRASDDVTALKGSTRLEAKKQRRREGRDAGRRRVSITEAEFLARRESVDRVMVVRQTGGRTQIGVLEDGVLVEHYVARQSQTSMVGNVYLGKVQNVLPSMEAAFVDIGKGRNAVLYAGEVNWDAAGLEGQPKRIEHALKSGEAVLVQVTKDPIGHKGARLTSQISLPGRYLVYVPDGSMTGISRKLPDNERARLKRILREVVPDDAGVIVRTAAEGASEEELRADVARLQAQWTDIKAKSTAVNPPTLLYGEPDLAIRVVRDIFNEDIAKLVVSGDDTWDTLQGYVGHVAPDLVDRLEKWEPVLDGKDRGDVFAAHRIDEQLAKALDRKVWLPSGGSLVIDRTEAMTVVDVNTGKFTGAGGNLEETVTKNNLEAAEEIVRQLRLRDIGGIIVVDFIDMVLESNRELVLRRLLECLGRDRTKHQVAEVTSLGLVQMTRKRVGQGLLEVFSESCEHCNGRGVIIHDEPVEKRAEQPSGGGTPSGNGGGGRRRKG